HPDRTGILHRAIREAVALKGEAAPSEAVLATLFDDLVGLGPLQPLMDDPTVSDILVNRFDQVYVERSGRLERSPVAFGDQHQLEQTIHKIVALVGREISVEKPVVDARMADGSRANAVLTPVGGPTLCIRKSTQERRLNVADLVQNALRMRPDRLIVGEIRHGKEAYYVLEALNTGHDGSATTIHASGCADSLARLELLIGREFSQLGPAELRRYIARVFDLIVFVARLRDGRRCLLEISELPVVDEGGHFQLAQVFRTDVRPLGTSCQVHFGPIQVEDLGRRMRDKLERQGIRWTC